MTEADVIKQVEAASMGPGDVLFVTVPARLGEKEQMEAIANNLRPLFRRLGVRVVVMPEDVTVKVVSSTLVDKTGLDPEEVRLSKLSEGELNALNDCGDIRRKLPKF